MEEDERRRSVQAAKLRARAVATALHGLVEVLCARDICQRLWPVPEIQTARVALRELQNAARPGTVSFPVRDQAEDQEKLLSVQPRNMMVADVGYWQACAVAWGAWAAQSE